jgi:hypothetical protein
LGIDYQGNRDIFTLSIWRALSAVNLNGMVKNSIHDFGRDLGEGLNNFTGATPLIGRDNIRTAES